MGHPPAYPGPRPPWAAAWDLLHPVAFERGYPGRLLSFRTTDHLGASRDGHPDRLAGRLDALRTVRRVARIARAARDGEVPQAPWWGGMAVFGEPAPEDETFPRRHFWPVPLLAG